MRQRIPEQECLYHRFYSLILFLFSILFFYSILLILFLYLYLYIFQKNYFYCIKYCSSLYNMIVIICIYLFKLYVHLNKYIHIITIILYRKLQYFIQQKYIFLERYINIDTTHYLCVGLIPTKDI